MKSAGTVVSAWTTRSIVAASTAVATGVCLKAGWNTVVYIGATAPVALLSRGKAVCSCFNVTEPEINQQLAGAAGSPDARLASVQLALQCGTQCGSCLPELRRLVRAATTAEPVVSADISS